MKSHVLQVIPDNAGSFRWQLLQPGDVALAFESHIHSDDVFSDYESALNAGTLALAAADDQAYKNESADPVGDSDSGAVPTFHLRDMCSQYEAPLTQLILSSHPTAAMPTLGTNRKLGRAMPLCLFAAHQKPTLVTKRCHRCKSTLETLG